MTELQELEVPGPIENKLTEPFWVGASEGQFKLQRCNNCKVSIFYPRAFCPKCWSSNLTWVDASGKGKLKSFSIIWKPGHPTWIPAVPYVVGLVELEEGPTMLSHILKTGDNLQIGDPLQFISTNIGGRVLPCFQISKKIVRK